MHAGRDCQLADQQSAASQAQAQAQHTQTCSDIVPIPFPLCSLRAPRSSGSPDRGSCHRHDAFSVRDMDSAETRSRYATESTATSTIPLSLTFADIPLALRFALPSLLRPQLDLRPATRRRLGRRLSDKTSHEKTHRPPQAGTSPACGVWCASRPTRG